ncbi:MAG TPA: D-aminoacylase [Thermoanaerobaculia bacterium]|nr:D-aminoacylase [Thermoanaerobaculia bacterium]
MTPPVASPTQNEMLDLKITNGRVLDGSGSPWFRADVGIRGDVIVAIGDLAGVEAKQTIDAQNRSVSPGFIDLLSWAQYNAIIDPQLEAHVRQGITTAVAGEGHSPGPLRADQLAGEEQWTRLGDYLDQLDRQGAAINFALLVGSANPRQMVIGDVNRPATVEELRQMEAIVEQAMLDGAIGLSTSLVYVPAMYQTTEELISLARVAAKHGGMYFSHIRSEGDQIDAALDEAFRIGREGGLPVNIWHLKIGPRVNWGKMPGIVAKIAAEREKGLDVSANVYPYAASGTALSTLAPDWAMEGGFDDFQLRLNVPEDRARIVEAFRTQVARRGEKGMYISQVFHEPHKQYEKKYLEEIARLMNVPPEEALVTLFSHGTLSPRVIYFLMNEDDVRHALKQPWISVGTDADSPSASARAAGTAVHPRAYGTFPRVLGRYSRDEKLFPLEEAIRKITSQAALRAHIFDRGMLRPGLKADVVIFDPAAVRDLSTFEDPHHYSEGISTVVVNGVAVMRDGVMTGATPGKSIRGRGYRGASANNERRTQNAE